MKIIGRKILDAFKRKHVDVCAQSDAWEAETAAASWSKPLDIKKRYAAASFLVNNQVIFNLKGTKYRLLVQINYTYQIVLIKKAGTHDEYMSW